MKNKICKSIICTLLIIIYLIGSLQCFAKGNTVDEVNTRIDGIISYEATEKSVTGKQGLVDYYTVNEMTLGGEWYVLSFIQNADTLKYGSYEKALIKYLKNNEVYSATTREKFALTLIALNTNDEWALNYIKNTCNESIGKQGIMSLVFGLHLLNNGCVSSRYTYNELLDEIYSLQNSDGGWSVSGEMSDVDVTAMVIQAVCKYGFLHKADLNKAVGFLSSMQSKNGDYKSYGTYNAESTCQVIIALSALRIDCKTDERFVKNGKSVLDGLYLYALADGSFSHTKDGKTNNSATSQAMNALVSYSRFLKGAGSFYLLPYSYKEPSSQTENTTSSQTENHDVKSTHQDGKNDKKNENPNQGDSVLYSVVTDDFGNTYTVGAQQDFNQSEENGSSVNGDNSPGEWISDLPENTNYVPAEELSDLNNPQEQTHKTEKTGLSEKQIKTVAIAVIIFSALAAGAVLFILKKRNKKNFIVIFSIAVILTATVLFLHIQPAGDYYSSVPVSDSSPVGTVTITVRCDTVMGKVGAPENPVILEKTEIQFGEGETVYDALARALRENKIMFEHNSTGYISGIDNLYEFQFGDLSGWMYVVNGKTPSVGSKEYVLSDGDEIQWLYTCEIGNDLNIYDAS